MKLLMLKGLPASGKSTHAFELVKKGWKRVNKDDLRAMIDGGQWSKKNEDQIVKRETEIAINYLGQGHNVVVDDTSFGWDEKWKGIAEATGAEFEVKFFDTPLEECIERDSKRGDKSVGEKVIRGMHQRNFGEVKTPIIEPDPNLPDCYIFDIDGTIALMNGRSPYDWKKVGTDLPNKPIMRLLQTLSDQSKQAVPVFLVSGRDESCREETEAWLKWNRLTKGWDYGDLYMRPAGDMRKDVIIKKEIYEREFKGKRNIICVFDDRDQVVKFWRSEGITCVQVAEGKF